MLGSITFWFTDQSTPKFLPTVRGIVVDNLLFRFSICGSVLDILAIKVESCKKSRRILDDFCPPKIFWGGPSKPESLRYISVTGHWSIFIRILMMGSERQARNVAEWIIAFQGHPRSSILVPIKSSCFFTAQCTLVHMRGLGIACRPSVRPSVRLWRWWIVIT